MRSRLTVEQLEERDCPSIVDLLLAFAPSTALHFSPADNFAHGSYTAPGDPGNVGFNLVAIYAPEQLAQVPNGYKAIVDMGPMTNGVDQHFLDSIRPYVGNPKVFGFYLVDEPNPMTVSPANLKAEADWVHANDPGAKAFFVMGAGPIFSVFTPQNTDMDYVGLDPYPIRSWGVNYEYIPLAVFSAELLGWSPSQIVPVYQAFGIGDFVFPSAAQEAVSMAIWGILDPHPAFDYAYSWGEWGAKSIVDSPALQAIFSEHNSHPPTIFSALVGLL